MSAPNWIALHSGQQATFILQKGTTAFPYHLHIAEDAHVTIRAEHDDVTVFDKFVWGRGVKNESGCDQRPGISLECKVQLKNQKTLGVVPPPGTLTPDFLSFDPDEFEKKL
ncbi:hypothetical protein MPSEU_000636200 [Mayamaea pseudoterrestris]|nr:hypothetical protein MPSEU_000636200 [Mayamaea pseudoterrestris]